MASGWHRLGGDTDSRSEAVAKAAELRQKDKSKHPSQQADYRVAKGYGGSYHIEFRLKH